MFMKRVIQSVIIASLVLSSTLALAQYEEESYIEGFVGANYSLPMGYIKNDLEPDSLNATGGIGFDIGIGYYLKPKLVTGFYFNARNMGSKEFELSHRVFEVGLYGKFFVMDASESSFAPYLRFTAGLNFSKLVAEVMDENNLPTYRELSHKPTLGTGVNVGIHYKTNDYGALFVELGFHYDFTDGISGEFHGVDYAWGSNNQFLLVKVGVMFNIGPKE
jgi:hypothetical protein